MLLPARVRRAPIAILSVLAVLAAGLVAAAPAQAVSPDLVISQVYGGGGNSGATYKNDFMEIYNRGTTDVSLAGKSIQYASSTGSSWNVTTLTGTLQPGKHYLVQQAAGTGGTTALPTPDATGTVAMSGTAGKVALVAGTAALTCGTTTSSCIAGGTGIAPIIDFVGYGTAATNFEGAGATATLSNTTAALRAGNGSVDTDNNNLDFSVGDPNPRNSVVGDQAPSVASTTPLDGATGVAPGSNITVTFSEPVGVAANGFNVACDGTLLAVTVGGGPTTFTLSMDPPLGDDQACSATVSADHVSDQDGNDPPDNLAADHSWSFDTASDICTGPVTSVASIQGSGTASPLAGQNVVTEGVVVADFQRAGSLSGFNIQDVNPDDDAATSDGVFVFGSSAPDVAVGDVVRVRGRATEFRQQTEIDRLTEVKKCTTADVPPPTALTLPEATNGDLERVEGMLVRAASPLTVQQNFFQGRFGQLTLGSGGRLFQPTNQYPARSADAIALADENKRRMVFLDDASSRSNPTPVPYLGVNGVPRAGDQVSNVEGVLDEGPINSTADSNFDYRIQPTVEPVFAATNPRTAAPDPVGGNLKVSSFNVLNYFTTFGGAARGADNAAEFERQRTKIFAAMTAIDADVFGLMEIENLPDTDAVRNLAEGLNEYRHTPGLYAPLFEPAGPKGTDAIKVAMIYKPSRVAPIGDAMRDYDPINNRPTLAQTFELKGNGERLSVVVNHFKSKGSCPGGAGPDADAGDGQGCWNATRVLQAQRLLTFIGQVKAAAGDDDALVIGDLNSYAEEDPIQTLKAGGLQNQILRYVGREAHSYVFDGMSGYLDHGLATAGLAAQMTGATEWYINGDEAEVRNYDQTFNPPAAYEPNAYRSSDHDPVVTGIELGIVQCRYADEAATKTRTLLSDCDTSHTILVPNGWTLDGAGHSITAKDPADGHFLGAVVRNAGASANVRNLTVTASSLNDVCDDGDNRLRGILLDGASGSILNNHVLGINQGASGCQEGNGIEVRNAPFDNTGVDKTVLVSGNEVRNYQKGGIIANGSVNVTVVGNTVDGVGPVDYIAQNGIQVAFGGTGVVESNTVTDNFYTGPDLGCGLLFFDADGVKQKKNTFAGNEKDICNFGRGGGSSPGKN